MTTKGSFNSGTIFIFEKYSELFFVFQGIQRSDEITFKGGESNTSGPLVQGKFDNYCIHKYCLEKQILNR